VGYLGLQKYLPLTKNVTGVFLETAHPVKFADTAPAALQEKIVTPERVQSLYSLDKKAVLLPNDYTALKTWLMQN
jgi:threonine synthase